MDLSSLRLLLAPAGQAALDAAIQLEPREVDFLEHFQQLSRSYPEPLARAALETAILRREAASKFPFAAQMYFTRQSLEQASSWEIATCRAARYSSFDVLADLGCSVGSDTLALAAAAPVVAIDLDPLRLSLARANLGAIDVWHEVTFVQADLSDPLPLARPPTGKRQDAALFFDPARRSGGRRVFSVSEYRPALQIVHNWLPDFPALGVKISPGVKLRELSGYDAEIEFISLKGDLKEAVLWFGPLKSAQRRATLLPGGYTLVSSGDRKLPIREPRGIIYEPDPAILRAGLVATLGDQLEAAQLDPDIAYLTADAHQPTPFARAWAVEDWFPFGLKRLRAYLRQRGVGSVTVKKRGSPLRPEALIKDLRLSGDEQRVIFLTHLRGQPVVVVATPGVL